MEGHQGFEVVVCELCGVFCFCFFAFYFFLLLCAAGLVAPEEAFRMKAIRIVPEFLIMVNNPLPYCYCRLMLVSRVS